MKTTSRSVKIDKIIDLRIETDALCVHFVVFPLDLIIFIDFLHPNTHLAMNFPSVSWM